MTEKELLQRTRANIQEKANLIWSIADKLVGPFKPHEYGNVILPMTVIKRFNDCLAPSKAAVLSKKKELDQRGLAVKDPFLKAAAGFDFYNVSNFDFESLLNDPDNIDDNFKLYLNGFSDNVQEILAKFDFEKEISRLASHGILFMIVQEFNTAKGEMGPDKISSVDMGYIFEELVRKFSESYNEQAGAHFTSRDIIYLMTDLLIAEDVKELKEDGIAKTAYDMAMGTSQMLACLTERIKMIDSDADVKCFGQEINPQTFAIAKADMLIKGGDSENMKFGDTLKEDQFSGYTFDYIISNPPFGIEYKVQKNTVEAEHKRGAEGRFTPGLPPISDSQMLFTLNGIKKLKDGGRMTIIQNGSPLFSGDAGSGPSEIRRYIIENDLLEAIVQLSTDSFYNTGISTYVWIISKDKSAKRAGKVQLIDASNMAEKMRKSMGSKRNEITETCREVIVKAYEEFLDKRYELGDKYVESKIFDNEDFGYYKIVVERPERDENGEIVFDKKGNPKPDARLMDTETVPLKENVNEYFNREVLSHTEDAWIDGSKRKIGYEIPFTRHFYKYIAPEKSEAIAARITLLEKEIMKSMHLLFKSEEELEICAK